MKPDWPFIFEWAFRPFFMLASFFLIGSLVFWLFVLQGIALTPETITPSDWHAHEMIYGFGSAALAGFILTAVPSWTNTAHAGGIKLQSLVGIWVFGRLCIAGLDFIPLSFAIIVNMAFPLYLSYLVIGPLWRDIEKKHVVFVFVLSLYGGTQLTAYLGWLGIGSDYDLSSLALYGGMYALIYAVVVTSTRISMVVVRHALDEQNDTESLFRPYPFRRNLASATFLIFAAGDFVLPETTILAWLAFAAGAAQLDRLSDFHVGRVLLKPYVLLVYFANLWIGLGCFGMGLNVFFELNAATDIRHIFAIGAMTTAILSVFTIAGLRHSGLELIVPIRVSIALICLIIAVVFRLLPSLPFWEISSALGYNVAFLALILAFSLYLSHFSKILCKN